MLKPWISDTGPKAPDGWGVAIANRHNYMVCDKCKEAIPRGDQYIYSYTTEGTIVLHNDEGCYELVVKAKGDGS